MISLPHGEYNINTTCQNSCLACNHFTPLQPLWKKEPAVIERDLGMAAKLIHFHHFCILGGEPTLHPQLLDILDIVRASGVTDLIKLNTNGQQNERWPDELFRKIDHLQVSPYKLSGDDRRRLTGKAKQAGIVIDWQDLGFRQVGYKHADAERGRRLFNSCWYRFNRHVIEDGYFYYCCVGRWIPETLLGLPRETEAIALDGLTEEKLREFLGAQEPPKSCLVCASNQGPIIGWREERNKGKWLEGTLG